MKAEYDSTERTSSSEADRRSGGQETPCYKRPTPLQATSTGVELCFILRLVK